MKNYTAVILTLILAALVYIGYTMTQTGTQPASTTSQILENLNANPDPADYETNYVPNLYNTAEQPTTAQNNQQKSGNPGDLTYDNVVGGRLCFPSEQIPPLEVYMVNQQNKSLFKKVETEANAPIYRFDNITPGKYVVYAYTVGNNELKGGYTKAVPCGLTIDCDDHKLIEINVTESTKINYADLCDWYTPDLPPRPDK